MTKTQREHRRILDLIDATLAEVDRTEKTTNKEGN